MLHPEHRLECLKLACNQATVSPLYFSKLEGEDGLKEEQRWSHLASVEVLALAGKYADFVEGCAGSDMNAPADPEFPA